MTISNSHFEENFSFGNGGAIWVESSSFAKLSIDQSTFVRNGALNGGVFGSTSSGVFTCTNCVFESNFGILGGVIYS